MNPGCMPASKIITVEIVMIPRPPACIRSTSTQFPKVVKLALMSMVESPVTHTADMAVKKASITPTGSRCANGSDKRSAPKETSAR